MLQENDKRRNIKLLNFITEITFLLYNYFCHRITNSLIIFKFSDSKFSNGNHLIFNVKYFHNCINTEISVI